MTEISGGAAFSAWLARRGMKQAFAAKELGVHKVTLSKWITGAMLPARQSRVAIEMFTEKHGEKLPREIWG